MIDKTTYVGFYKYHSGRGRDVTKIFNKYVSNTNFLDYVVSLSNELTMGRPELHERL